MSLAVSAMFRCLCILSPNALAVQGDDVEPRILPFSPTKPNPESIKHQDKNSQAPFNKQLWQKQVARYTAGDNNSIGSPSSQPPRPNNSLYPAMERIYKPKPSISTDETGNKGHTNLPPYFRFLLSPTLARAKGVPASIWTVKTTTEINGTVSKKYEEVHFIICWYQFIIGALGGIVVGIETGFFASSRLADPHVLVPEKLSLIRNVAQFGIQQSSSFYRVCKRLIISGYLFDVIDKNLEEYREKQDWKNMGMSGGITGAIFGLRGGFRGAVTGSLLFCGFSSIAGYQYQIKIN